MSDCESILGSKLLPLHHTPTGCNEEELFGVSYLYHQADMELELSEKNLAAKEKEDEELTDEGFIDDTVNTAFSEDPRTIVMNFDADEIAAEEEEEVEDEMVRTFKAPRWKY